MPRAVRFMIAAILPLSGSPWCMLMRTSRTRCDLASAAQAAGSLRMGSAWHSLARDETVFGTGDPQLQGARDRYRIKGGGLALAANR